MVPGIEPCCKICWCVGLLFRCEITIALFHLHYCWYFLMCFVVISWLSWSTFFCKKGKCLIFLSLVFIMSSETSSPSCLFWFLNYMYLFCIYGHSAHILMSVRVRGQLDLSNLFSPRGYWDGSQVVMFGGRCLYLLSYLTCPRVFVCLLAYLLACFLRY